jgi:glyoxylase-like metal-dependent hydrolase (beta-lactamase superfamily II)
VLLAGIEYGVYLPGRGDVVVRWSWEGWTQVPDARTSHVWAPARHALEIAGTPFQQVEYTRFESGAADASSLIAATDRPAGTPMGTMSPAPAAVGSATGEVAPGVHVAVIRGFTVMFVAFKDFVVALDAPEPHPGLEAVPPRTDADPGVLTREYLALIDKTIPGKPVRYVVVSHHHSDHMGGVREFAAAGATILAARSDVQAVRRAVDTPGASVEAVGTRRVIGDGDRTLEIMNVGPNPHTQDNLLAWLPRERLIFQADLFYYSEGAPFPPSGRATMNQFFAGWLRRHQIKPAAVYGVHNRGAAGPEALALAYKNR